MSKETALSRFRQEPYNYSCAQTVCAAFGRVDLVCSLSYCGGGKAPEGLCGALYGACQVVPECRDEIIRDFSLLMGAHTCRELKRAHHTPCPHCVATASDLVERYRETV